MILQARARTPEGPDQNDLRIIFSNDPVWRFFVRREAIDGSLVKVTEGDVRLVIRANPRASLEDCEYVTAEHYGDGIWEVAPRADQFTGAKTRYQLDHMDEDSRRTTHSYGTVTKEDVL